MDKAVALAIRRERRIQEITQEELSTRAGMPEQSLGYVERGARCLTVDELTRLAAALGVDPLSLWPKDGA